jgi:rhodanese-related sulfurtransferase
MRTPAQLAVVIALSLAGAGGTYLIKGAPKRAFVCDPASLKPDEVCLEQLPADQKILWVDARTRSEWKRDGMPGSVLWNQEPGEDAQAFEAEIVPLILETPRVVVYCGNDNCGLSREIAKKIRALELNAEVSVLRGGWQALSDAGKIKGSNPKP